MLNFESYAAFAFVVILGILVYVYREKLVIQKVLFPLLYIVMLRTKVGLPLMDKVAKRFPRVLKWVGYIGVVLGFVGMVAICGVLLQNLYALLFVPSSTSGVALIQPFAKGIPGTFFVPFFYFIISIFVLILIHEFSHGVMARVHGIKVHSSGLAILGILLPILPAAFVEPDEKILRKRPAWQQLSVFAAGPFSNIVCAALVLLLIIFAINPVVGMVIQSDGVEVTSFYGDNTYPAQISGIMVGDHIIGIDGVEIDGVSNFTGLLQDKHPGDIVTLATNTSSYTLTLVENPENETKGYMGIFVKPHITMREEFINAYGMIPAKIILWIAGLFMWLYILNIGIGLFNLLPIPIVDGGRMLEVFLSKVLPKKRAHIVWKRIGTFFFLLILVNLILGFIR